MEAKEVELAQETGGEERERDLGWWKRREPFGIRKETARRVDEDSRPAMMPGDRTEPGDHDQRLVAHSGSEVTVRSMVSDERGLGKRTGLFSPAARMRRMWQER